MNVILKKPLKSARKAKGDGHLRRAEILEAAERIFVAEGYEGATIRKIADEVGVSSTALYMHFRDKDEILIEICNATMESLLASNSEISARPISAVTRVRLMLEAYIRFALEHPNAYRLAFCGLPAPSFSAKSDALEDIGSKTYDRYVGVVREIAAEGRLRSGDADTAAQALWTACHGMVALIITKPSFNWSAPEELMKVLLDSLLYGLIAD